MNITSSTSIPDGTYFRAGDAEPVINADGTLTILNGQGTRRSSWGAPGVTSTVVHQDCDLVAVHVGFHHKHGGGQFWRYYTTDGATTREVTWASLPDEARQAILDAAKRKAPSWAKEPGKLRSEYAKPTQRKAEGYKIVAVEDDKLVSLYDGRTEYAIGKRLGQAVDPLAGVQIDEYGVPFGPVVHAGGFYTHPTAEAVMRLYHNGSLVPQDRLFEGMTLALVRCEIAGRFAQFPNGKRASTYITPLEIVDTWQHSRAAMAA